MESSAAKQNRIHTYV